MYKHVGSAPSSLSGVGGAFATATSEVDFTTGQFIGGGVNLSLPEVTINTLANIIAACINSASGSAPCTSLYSNTGDTSDTIAAALQMAKTPAVNAATLYGLIAASAPFQPHFSSVPTDFTTTVGFTVPAFIQTGTLDSNGQIWLYFGGYNYDTATDTSTDSPGYIAVYDNNFNQLFTVSPGTGGLELSERNDARRIGTRVYVKRRQQRVGVCQQRRCTFACCGLAVRPFDHFLADRSWQRLCHQSQSGQFAFGGCAR